MAPKCAPVLLATDASSWTTGVPETWTGAVIPYDALPHVADPPDGELTDEPEATMVANASGSSVPLCTPSESLNAVPIADM